MNDSGPGETIRAIFRSLHAGNLRLRKAPTVKIDKRVLLAVFAPAKRLTSSARSAPLEKPAGAKAVSTRRNLHVVRPGPKRK
jgi:hypothetical protein